MAPESAVTSPLNARSRNCIYPYACKERRPSQEPDSG
jgi:hypothetical protein